MAIGPILFVCTGNTGRSVMAEALARQRIGALALPLTVSSRGIAVDPRHSAPERHAVSLLVARGIDVTAHRALPLTARDVAVASTILTMTEAQRQIVLVRFPDANGKVRMLSAITHDIGADIPDGFGKPLAIYESILGCIDAAVARFFGTLPDATA